MRSRIQNAWFLTSLAILLALALWQGPSLLPIARHTPRGLLVAAIMFVTALPIDIRGMGAVRGAWFAVVLAVGVNAIGAPLFGWAASLFVPGELSTGFIVALASPCTIASAVVWTRRGGGNDAVAILVTLITNLGCFLVMPLWIELLLSPVAGANAPNLAPKLLVFVVLPILAAQLLRRVPAVADYCAAKKPLLSIAAQLGVLIMAFIGAIEAGAKLHSADVAIGPGDWLLVGAGAAAVHVALLAFAWWSARASGLNQPEAVAVAIAGSQKTLAVGVAIALEFGGLAIFPMILYHVAQLLIDTVFVDRMKGSGD